MIKSENSLSFRLSMLLCALVAIVPFLWNEDSLQGAMLYKYMAIESVSMLLAVLVLFFYVKEKNSFELKLPVLLWPVIGFHIMAVLSILWAVDAGAASVQFVHMIGLFVLFSLVAYFSYIQPIAFPILLVRVSVAAAVVLSLIGLLQNFGYLESLFYQVAAPAGTMVNKNVLAQYVGTVLFPSLLMIFWSKGRRELMLSAFAFSIILAMLLVTYTRGAWLGAFAASLILLVYLKFHAQLKESWLDDANKRGKHIALMIALAIAVVLMMLPSPVNKGSLQSKFLDAIDQPEEGAAAFRVALYMNSWKLFTANPFGIGLANWRNVYPEYHQALRDTPGYGMEMQPRNLHSDPYKFFIEMGLFGGLFFLSILILLIWTVWKMLAHLIYSRQQRLILLSLFLSLMGVGVHSLVSFPFDSPASAMQIWLWLGVIAGLSLCYVKQGTGRSGLFVFSLSVSRKFTASVLIMMLLGLMAMLLYQRTYLQASELEKEAYTLFKADKCAESLLLIDASVQQFPYIYTATMRRSMYHHACDPDRLNVFNISSELLKREPYYLNLLIYMLPSALENGRLDVVDDVSKRLIDLFPDLPVGYHWQGMLAGGKGEYRKARTLFVQALEKDADFQPSKDMIKPMDAFK